MANIKTPKPSLLKTIYSYIVSAGFLLSSIVCLSIGYTHLTNSLNAFASAFIFFGFLITFSLLLMIFVILKQLTESYLENNRREVNKLQKESDYLTKLSKHIENNNFNSSDFSGSLTMVDDEGRPICERFSSEEEYNSIIDRYSKNIKFENFFKQLTKKSGKLKEKIKKPLNETTEKELENLKNEALEVQDFEFAAKIRDEIEKRKTDKK